MTAISQDQVEAGAPNDVDLRSPRTADSQQERRALFRLDLDAVVEGRHKLGDLNSVYVPANDGVRIALDVTRPMGDTVDSKRDTILVMTCYGRGKKREPSNSYADLFVPHGYAVVVGDVRGTGASFGVWPGHRSREEILDFSDILDWIAEQSWSTGNVVAYGLSYTANSADLIASRNHSALKGIVPRYVDYDIFFETWPGGAPNLTLDRWSELVESLNRDQNSKDNSNRSSNLRAGIRPVGSEAELAAALLEHGQAPSFISVSTVTCREEWLSKISGFDFSPQAAADLISKSGVPMQNWSSWFDSGAAQGSIRRFLLQSNPMNVIIGPWNHCGRKAYDPLRPDVDDLVPTMQCQQANDFRFVNGCFNGEAVSQPDKVIHYYTCGEGVWKSTRSWPVPATRQRWYIASGSRLSSLPEESGFDLLQVDREFRDVLTNRWDTNGGIGTGEVDYDDRQQYAAARLTYTSAPLERDLEITGHPIAELNVSSTREDGIFFVYLEAVSPDGVSCYLTEGVLRGPHRKVWKGSPFSVLGPQQSYLKSDAEPLVPGQPAKLAFTLLPISALLPAGYRLRVCLAGSESTSFANVPSDGDAPELQFYRGVEGCYIDVPVVER
ncbi:CocE/NonD family hydrolase [Rhizobium indigoferae]|uniref:CocE/NonD family hydrolase n=1 Tax=Rhizobium indigoferae TaxID=158891 RepID=A0ABZ1DQ02_9HYPH|nr:CocE/NonD family hydrolase [Rhizobium indigoferae]WRW37538.1 CocE/NonD family hydrolase [Rhizobium indigoferae]GLR59753.1 putative serine esterase [Rhizobium indigoferae]